MVPHIVCASVARLCRTVLIFLVRIAVVFVVVQVLVRGEVGIVLDVLHGCQATFVSIVVGERVVLRAKVVLVSGHLCYSNEVIISCTKHLSYEQKVHVPSNRVITDKRSPDLTLDVPSTLMVCLFLASRSDWISNNISLKTN